MSSGRHFIFRHSLSDYRSYRCGVASADIRPQAGRLAFQPKFPYFADFLIFATLSRPQSKPPCGVLRHGGLDHGARFTLQSLLATSVCVGSNPESWATDSAKFEVCPVGGWPGGIEPPVCPGSSIAGLRPQCPIIGVAI